MAGYTPNTWNVGDKITKPKLDRLEQGVADADLSNPASPAAAAVAATYVTFDGTNLLLNGQVINIGGGTTPTPDLVLLTETGDYLTLETGDLLLTA